MKKSEVFVITEDDILKPSSLQKRKGPKPVDPPAGLIETAPGRAPTMAASVPTTRSGRRRSPAIASSLSLWIWGLGQLYNGDTKLATFFFLCQAQVAAFHYMLYATWGRLRNFADVFFISEWELFLYVAAIDICLLFLMMFNVAQAYRTAEIVGHGGRYEGMHQPLVSGLASLLVPGWGQMLNGQLGKGMVFLSVFVLQGYLLGLYMLSPFYRVVLDLDPQQVLLRQVITGGMVALFATAVAWVISAYDATLVACYTRRLRG
jgi:TM2 domain-containing membrane protein YozV